MPSPSIPAPVAEPSSLGLSALGPRLAALGTVLCLYRRELVDHLDDPTAWLQLCGGPARALCELSGEGPREALRFSDPAGRPLMQVCMLCDSDFFAWERALEAPCVVRDPSPAPLCQLPWLARLRWQASLVRLGAGERAGRSARGRPISAAGARMADDWCRRYGCVLDED